MTLAAGCVVAQRAAYLDDTLLDLELRLPFRFDWYVALGEGSGEGSGPNTTAMEDGVCTSLFFALFLGGLGGLWVGRFITFSPPRPSSVPPPPAPPSESVALLHSSVARESVLGRAPEAPKPPAAPTAACISCSFLLVHQMNKKSPMKSNWTPPDIHNITVGEK